MEKDIVQYKEYNDFKCITDKCKYTCCSGWQVDIDDETYKKYSNLEYFKDDIVDKFKKDDKNKFSMKMNNKNDCTFLQENKLCEIHASLGEDFLCNTCRIYPRGVNVVGGRVERFLYSSCPAMIEMFLLGDKKLTFETTKGNYNDVEISKVIEFKNDMEKIIFTAIRGFTIEVIQSRFIDLEEKFILMGLAYSNFNDFLKNEDYDATLNAIDIYIEMIEDSSSIPKLENTDMYNVVKQIVLGEIAQFNLKSDFKELLPNLNNVLDGDLKLKKKYDLYIKENNVNIENYLVNIVYSSGMPFLDGEIMDSYILIIIKYIAFKTYIMSVQNEKIKDEDFIDIVALSSRSFDHNKLAVNMLIEELKTLANSSEDSIGLLVNLIK